MVGILRSQRLLLYLYEVGENDNKWININCFVSLR